MNDHSYEIINHSNNEYPYKTIRDNFVYLDKTQKYFFSSQIKKERKFFYEKYFENLNEIYPEILSYTEKNTNNSRELYINRLIQLLEESEYLFADSYYVMENINKLTLIVGSLEKSSNYCKSLFSLFRTIIFYIDIPGINFFINSEKNILGVNMQKEKQSLTIEFSSDSMIHYSYAFNEYEEGIFRMTGRAKLTKFVKNSYHVMKIIQAIR